MADETIQVQLIAKIDGFAGSMKQAADALQELANHAKKHTQESEDALSELANKAKDFATDIAAALGIGFGIEKLVEFGKASAEQAEQVQKLSQSLGVSTQSVQLMSYAAGITGSSLDTMAVATERLERASVEAASGNAKYAEEFRAIGVSVTDASGHLKSAEQLLFETTAGLSSFQDGATKTTVAMSLMGRGAAQNIPLINELGQNVDELKKQAEEAGIILSNTSQKSLVQFQEGSNKLGQDLKGLANIAMVELAPALTEIEKSIHGWLVSGEAKEAAKGLATAIVFVVDGFQSLRDVAESLVAAFDVVFTTIKDSALIAWETIRFGFQTAVADIQNGAVNISTSLSKVALGPWNMMFGSKIDEVSAKLRSAGPDADAFAKRISGLTDDIKHTADVAAKTVASYQDYANATRKAAAETALAGTAHEEAGKKVLDYNANIAKTSGEADKAKKALSELVQMGNTLAGQAGGPYVKAWENYQNQLVKISEKLQEVKTNHGDVSAATKQAVADSILAKDAYDTLTAAIKEQHDALAQQQKDLTEAQQLLGVMPNEYDAAKAALDRYNKSLKDHFDLEGNYIQNETELKTALDAQIPTYQANQQAIIDLNKTRQQSMQDIQDWIGIAKSGFESVGHSIADFATGSVKSWHDFGKSLIADAKSMIASIIEEFFKLDVVRPLLASLFGGNSGVAGASGIGSLGGLISGGGAAGGAASGGGILSLGSNLLGSLGGGVGGLLGTVGGIVPGGLGVGLSGAGALIGSQGLLGGLTSSFGAGMGALGSGSIMTGIGAMLPMIGAVVGGLSLINSLTGGGVFGTSWKPTGSTTSLAVGSSGASLSNTVDESRKAPVFGLLGGSTHKQVSGAIDPAAQQAATDFFNSLKTQDDAFAKQFGVTMGDIVGGTFKQTFDKAGKLTGSSDTVGGVTYHDTQPQFEERIEAANILAVLDKLGIGASAFVANLQGDADKLFAATQDLGNTAAAIQANLKAGAGLVAAGADADLKGILTFVEGVQQSGETLAQAYTRLMQAQQAYDQFVGQFKPGVTYVDAFEGALDGVYTTLKQSIAQANALAQAAGRAGAAQEDLTNIQAAAAKQGAALIAQLQGSAEGGAVQLGYVNTLDSLNQQISALESSSGSASSSVSGFGNAMQSAADAAKSAMDLLLGDLSPLNDQQKLQTAIGGYQSGTVSEDQVLQIGRRLFASSQQYVDLFNSLQGMQHVTPTTGGTATATAGGTESGNLAELIKERDDMQAAARLKQAQELAQQIADLSMADGASFEDVAKQQLGFPLTKLGDDLHLQGDKLNAYLTSLESTKDSNNQNTASIVAAINALPVAIAKAVVAATPASSTGTTDNTMAATIAGAVSEGLQKAMFAAEPRSSRYAYQ